MKPPISGWLITGARGHAMQCGPDRPDMTVIHGNDPVQSVEPLYSQDVIDAKGAKVERLRDALYIALPFVQDAEDMDVYKPGSVRVALKKILAAINQQEQK